MNLNSRRPLTQADPQPVLQVNCDDQCIEDSCRIRTGYGPENITQIRRCTVGSIKTKAAHGVTQTMRELNRNTRLVLGYLRMTKILASQRPLDAASREQIYLGVTASTKISRCNTRFTLIQIAPMRNRSRVLR